MEEDAVKKMETMENTVKSLEEENAKLKKEISEWTEWEDRQERASEGFSLIAGNLLYFGVLQLIKRVVDLWYGSGLIADPNGYLILLICCYWVLVIQGVYRLVCDIIVLFQPEMKKAGEGIVTFIRETREARKEYFEKREKKQE